MNNNKTTFELGTILKEMYGNALDGEKVTQIHFFGVKYADEIKKNGISIAGIVKASGIRKSYNTEVNKGVKLAKYVVVKESD